MASRGARVAANRRSLIAGQRAGVDNTPLENTMKMLQLGTAAPLALALIVTTLPARAQVQASGLHPDGAAETARQAFIYGYPLVTMAITKRVMTNVATATTQGHAPVNQFTNLLAFPTAAFKEVVAPNVNTLYTSAWLDLSKEPMIVHIPDTKGRYYVMQTLDMWTNVIAAPGKRTTGTGEQNIAIVGPGWQGKTPPGITHTYLSPTAEVWIINRILADGPKDYSAVNAIQRAMTITPLSMFGKPYTPPTGTVNPSIDMKTPPLKQVNAMPAETFFSILAHEMTVNPQASADTTIVKRMMTIGVVPGQAFKMPNAAALAKEIRDGVAMGLASIEKHSKTIGAIKNNWQTLNMCGNFGADYLTRAAVAMIGLGCNLPQDAIYPTTTLDATGTPLDGSNRYVVHFAAGQLPPVEAFWSITLYDASFFLVSNPTNRYAVSSYDDLKKNPDGSLDIYVQQASPGADKTSNWLPAPAGKFVLMARLYWPKADAINASWAMPGVQKAP
jgi:hypothetical protein